jgi:hypothetical protein
MSNCHVAKTAVRERVHLSAILAFLQAANRREGKSDWEISFVKNKAAVLVMIVLKHIMYHHHSGAHTHRHW